MGRVVSLEDYWRELATQKLTSASDTALDTFLIDEGLELLASYRSISDRETRLKIKALVEKIARDQG